MKRSILLIIIFSLLFTSCVKKEFFPLKKEQLYDDEFIEPRVGWNQESYYLSSQEIDIRWNQLRNLDGYITEKVALDISIAVIKYVNSNFFNEKTVYSNSYFENMNAYVIQFKHEYSENEKVSLAISKKNGEILPFETDESIIELVDEKLAYQIAISIIKNYEEDFFDKPTDYYLAYRDDLDAYFLCFCHSESNLLGGDFNIVISRENGSVLACWMGE